MSREDFEGLALFSKQNKQNHIDGFHKFILPKVRKFVEKSKGLLELDKLTDNQFRIINLNTRKFIDVWHTRTMRTPLNQYCGIGYKDKNLDYWLGQLLILK